MQRSGVLRSRVLRAAAVALAAATALVLAGCASVPDQLAQHLDSGISATASERTAVQQLGDGLALPPFVTTVLSDGLTELQDATTQVEELDAATPSEREARTAALAALRVAVDATLEARETVADASGLNGAGLEKAEAALDEANEALEALKDELP